MTTRTFNRPPSLGVYADRALPRGTRPPEPLPQAGAIHCEALASILGITPSTTYVSERTAGGLPALDAGVTLISSAVATMMKAACVYSPVGDELAVPPVVARPHPLFTSTEFWQTGVRSLLMRGNFVAIYADYDQAGWPRQLVPVDSSAVSVEVSTGIPYYLIGGEMYRFDEVFHVRKDAPIGTCWGMGVVEKFRVALQGQLAEQQYGKSAYSNGGVPSVVVTLPTTKPSQTELDNLADAWQVKTSAQGRVPVFVPKDIQVTPISWSPEDADFVAARQLSAADCAYMLGLQPSDLEASIGGQSQLYANITERRLSRVTDAYSPIMSLFEEALSDALPGQQRVEGKVEALLRSTTKERYELHALGQQIGIETPEESRAMEKRPPVETHDTEEDA